MPSLDLLPSCACMRARVAEYALRRPFPWIISSSFFLLAWIVTSPRIALMLRETRRNLYSAVNEYPTRPRLVQVLVSTYICEIFLGITLIISALKLASIALGVGSRFNLISRYLSISLMGGMTVIMIASVKYLLTSS